MRKNFIFFAIITLLCISVNGQLKFMETQINAKEEKTDLLEKPTSDESNEPSSYIELNKLGVKKSLEENDYETARDLFERAVEANPKCLTCRYNLGRAFFKLNMLDKASRIFNELIVLKPDFADSYASLGEVLSEKKQYKESLSVFEKALELSPNDAVIINNYAISLDNLGDYKKALQSFDKAIKLKPDLAEAHSSRGVTLFKMGKQKEAYKSLMKANEINSKDAETHNSLGVVLDEMGKRKKAHEHYMEAIRLKPDFSEAIYNLALHYLEDKKTDEAKAQLKVLEKIEFEFARILRSHIWGKYILDASSVKKKK